MKTIYKYQTPFQDFFTLEMPVGAEILTVQQDEKTNWGCIWALVDTDNEKEERTFELFGTGNEIHVDMGVDRKYIGTYQYQRGNFVGHIFERF